MGNGEMAKFPHKKRVSKKTKKGWRKGSNIDDVEKFLEQARNDERTGVNGGKNCQLFFVDNQKKPSDKKSNTDLKCHQGLTLDSSIPPVHVSQKVFKEAKKPIKLTASKTQKRQAKPQGPLDLWATDATPEEEELDEHFAYVCKKRRVKPPSHYYQKPSEVQTIEVPAPGASYNPVFDDHQALLQKAIEIEEKKEIEEKRLKRALDDCFPVTSEKSLEANWLKEMSSGLMNDETEALEKKDNEDNEDEFTVKSSFQTGCEQKKTEKQRRKEKERQMADKARLKEKEVKNRENEKFRLKSIKQQLKRREMKLATRAAWKELEKDANKLRPKKLGKLKYEEPTVALKLTEELTDSLRKMKPEGHIAEMMFKHLQKKNVIEPRQRAKPLRRFKSKLYEKKGHKSVTL